MLEDTLRRLAQGRDLAVREHRVRFVADVRAQTAKVPVRELRGLARALADRARVSVVEGRSRAQVATTLAELYIFNQHPELFACEGGQLIVRPAPARPDLI